jgi:hypothetical protein
MLPGKISCKLLTAILALTFCAAAWGAREMLTANRTYFVSTSGSDSDDCLTVATACRTKQHVSNLIQSTLDLACNKVIVQSLPGTYTDPLSVTGPYVGACSRKAVQFLGDTAGPYTNVTQSVTDANAFQVNDGASIYIEGFYCLATGNGVFTGFCLLANGGRINFGQMNFGQTSAAHIDAGGNSSFIQSMSAWYIISGGATIHAIAEANAIVAVTNVVIVTLQPVAYSVAFTQVDQNASIILTGSSMAGYCYTSAGKKWNAISNGVIDTGGKGEDWPCGSIPGGPRSLGGVYY